MAVSLNSLSRAPKVLNRTRNTAKNVAKKALEGKPTNVKEALKYFDKNPNAIYTPTVILPSGTRVYYTRSTSGFAPPLQKHVVKPNGRTITAAYFPSSGHNAPMHITEYCPNGAEIKTTFPGTWAGKNSGTSTWLTTPDGTIYGCSANEKGSEYYKYVQHGWKRVEGNPKYLETMYKNNVNAARMGYPKANL